MSRTPSYPFEPPASKEGHKALTQRLEERHIKFLPVKRVRWVKDVKR